MINSIKSAIVIGATGLVGKRLLYLLNESKRCDKITAIVRSENEELNKIKKVHQIVLNDFFLLNRTNIEEYTHAFSCLGSTIKKAGSKDNFYCIDFEMNAHFASLFQNTETHYLLISALGANAQSKFFYNQVKGQLEQYIQSLALSKVSIIQPSLLLGHRDEQRTLEDFTQKLYLKFSHLVPNTFKYKPVTSEQVAHTMVEAACYQTEKLKIYDNLEIHQIK